jgi:hypothetical protein
VGQNSRFPSFKLLMFLIMWICFRGFGLGVR